MKTAKTHAPAMPSHSDTDIQPASKAGGVSACEVENVLPSVPIRRDSFYRPKDIRKVFGIRFLNYLTRSGLRAIGGWYSGEAILETFRQIRQDKACQRVSAGKEVEDEAEDTEEEDRVEESGDDGAIQSLSSEGEPEDLLSQMAEV